MSKATLLSDSLDKQGKAVAACNEIARRLVGHLHPFMGDAEAILSAEEDEVLSLGGDLVNARTQLKRARDDCDALKRRA